MTSLSVSYTSKLKVDQILEKFKVIFCHKTYAFHPFFHLFRKIPCHYIFTYEMRELCIQTGVSVMVFNTTFNNISVRPWRSVLLVEETGVSGKNYWPATSHWQTLSHNVVLSTPPLNCLYFCIGWLLFLSLALFSSHGRWTLWINIVYNIYSLCNPVSSQLKQSKINTTLLCQTKAQTNFVVCVIKMTDLHSYWFDTSKLLKCSLYLSQFICRKPMNEKGQ